MPKQRNHPHRHGKQDAAGAEFQPPTVGPFQAHNPLNPTPYTYPTGWVLRPWYRSRSWTVRIFMFVWMAGLAVGLLVAILNALGIGR